MSKGYIVESIKSRIKEGYPNLCWMDISEKKLEAVNPEDVDFKLSYHHVDSYGYQYSYVYGVNAKDLKIILEPFRSRMRRKKQGSFYWRLYLDYKTGEVYSAMSPRTRKTVCKLRKVYKELPVRLGNYAIKDALKRVKSEKNSLLQVIVRTAVWAPKEAYLAQKDADLKYVRKRPSDTRKKGCRDENDNILDDNSRPNRYIKASLKNYLGYTVAQNEYNVCHIWDELVNGDKTCYDPRYFANLGNLVLVPKSLASLTDYLTEVKDTLKARAYESFGFIPDGETISQGGARIRARDWLILKKLK